MRGERQLVAILQEAPRLAAGELHRLLAATRDLEQRAPALRALGRERARPQQVARLQVAPAAGVMCHELRRRPVHRTRLAERESVRRQALRTQPGRHQKHLKLERQRAMRLVRLVPQIVHRLRIARGPRGLRHAEGRERFGRVRLFRREDGVKPIVSALRQHELLYLLPDMNFGPSESIFVPFYGEVAATVPSLSRFAKLGRARVVPVITRMTQTGYEVVVHPAWQDFPSDDAEADTALMNQRLEAFINTMPAQYFWVHKRFKTRPPGAPELY